MFGGAAVLAIHYIFMFLSEEWIGGEKYTILDHVASGLADASGARGFGMEFIPKTSLLSQAEYLIVAALGSGPFSAGGGLGLIGILFFVRIFTKRSHDSKYIQTAFSISKNWLIFSLIFLTLAILFMQVAPHGISISRLLQSYFTLRVTPPDQELLSGYLLLSVANVAGRVSYIIACFMTLPKQI